MNILTISRHGRFLSAQPVAQRAAGQVLHRQEDLALVDADVVDRDDVRVRQLRDRLGLAHQARLAARRDRPALVRAQQLERDLAIELRIVGGVDDAHRAGAEALEHEVAADGRAAGEDVGREEVHVRALSRARPEIGVSGEGLLRGGPLLPSVSAGRLAHVPVGTCLTVS